MTRWEYLYVTFWIDEGEVLALEINGEQVRAEEAKRMGIDYSSTGRGAARYGPVHTLLNRIGIEEWELISTINETDKSGFIFKRSIGGHNLGMDESQKPTGFEPGFGGQRG